ncbi:hypothetical protein I4F81_002984 [Pyropia yezoensis]|uniref:Uncharacterized protein n=1 Tax=Pyropia yezoensis TaxID=2788 RepID=A0ACC3BR25_PYRYE|nr:hypothetical protein I4F81_002984 [Neopyropia yezoensis]
MSARGTGTAPAAADTATGSGRSIETTERPRFVHTHGRIRGESSSKKAVADARPGRKGPSPRVAYVGGGAVPGAGGHIVSARRKAGRATDRKTPRAWSTHPRGRSHIDGCRPCPWPLPRPRRRPSSAGRLLPSAARDDISVATYGARHRGRARRLLPPPPPPRRANRGLRRAAPPPPTLRASSGHRPAPPRTPPPTTQAAATSQPPRSPPPQLTACGTDDCAHRHHPHWHARHPLTQHTPTTPRPAPPRRGARTTAAVSIVAAARGSSALDPARPRPEVAPPTSTATVATALPPPPPDTQSQGPGRGPQPAAHRGKTCRLSRLGLAGGGAHQRQP